MPFGVNNASYNSIKPHSEEGIFYSILQIKLKKKLHKHFLSNEAIYFICSSPELVNDQMITWFSSDQRDQTNNS